MKVNVKFTNWTTGTVSIPEVQMFWSGSSQKVALQLRSMEIRNVEVPLDNIFAPYKEVSYKYRDGVLKPKCTKRSGWSKIDPLRKAKNVVLFINNTNKTCHFREESQPGGASAIHVPRWMSLRRVVEQKGKFENCKKVIMSQTVEKGIVENSTFEGVSYDYQYK